MSIDFQAFSVHVVLENFQKKIDVLEVWEDKVLAGLADGTLVVLDADGSGDGPWQVVQAVKAFAKRQFLQLQVWHQRTLLLSLDEDGVSAYKLPGLQLHCLVNRTKYAQRFAWDPVRGALAVTIKRRLLLFNYDGNEFVEQKELSLADTALRLAWLGESLCVAYKKEYVLVNTSSGATSELFKAGGDPCITLLDAAPQELLLAKGNVGIFLGADARISRKTSLTWSDAPMGVAFSRPYAVALLPNYIEIRSVQRMSANGLAQVMPVGGVTLAAPSCMQDGSVVIASGKDGSIRRLQPIPFQQQAEALADAGELEEALRLAQLMPDSEAGLRRGVTDQMHTRLGYRLFAESEFDEAMAHFGMCSDASPLVLLHLFPSLAPPHLIQALAGTISGYKLPELPEPSGADYRQAVEVLLPYLLSHRSRLASLQDRGSDEEASGVASSEEEEDDAAMSPKKAGQAGIRDLDSDQRHLLSVAVDTAILKAMLATNDSGALLRFVQRKNCVDVGEGEAALQAAGRFSELAALYESHGRHADALDLLRKLSQRRQDLPVEPTGAAAELGGLTGVWAAVKYLISIGPSRLDLVKRHARWILKADPEAGLDMFLQLEAALPPAAALPILTAQAPGLCAPYLEAILASDPAAAAAYHNDLAAIYMSTILDTHNGRQESPEEVEEDGGGDESGTSEQRPSPVLDSEEAMRRLKELVMTSSSLDADRILRTLPAGRLPELRALLLERTGQHREALRLYVHTLRDLGLAEALCDRVHAAAAAPEGRPGQGEHLENDMYLMLIQVVLEQGRSGEQQCPAGADWAAVAQLLGRKLARIDPRQALKLLPDEVALRTCLPLLKGSLQSAGEQRRNAAIVRSLRRAENLGVREEGIRCKQRSVMVSFERACRLCHKRIGSAAFVAYPGGPLAHYSCYKRDELPSSETGRNTLPQVQVYDISL